MARYVRKAYKQPSGLAPIFIILLLVAALVFVTVSGIVVVPRNYTFESSSLPKTFVGYKVVQVSNLCDKTTAAERTINYANPDLIVVTGNITSKSGSYSNSVNMLNRLAEKTNVCLILGENDVQYYDNIKQSLSQKVALLDNSYTSFDSKYTSYDQFVSDYIEKRYVKQAEKDANSSAAKYLEYTKEMLESSKDAKIDVAGLNYSDSVIDDIYSAINLDRNNFQIVVASSEKVIEPLKDAGVNLALVGNTTEKVQKLISDGGLTIVCSSGIAGETKITLAPEIVAITLSDGTINKDNPLEKLLASIFVEDVESRFANDGGFTAHRYTYD